MVKQDMEDAFASEPPAEIKQDKPVAEPVEEPKPAESTQGAEAKKEEPKESSEGA